MPIVSGSLTLPGDKSISHRAALFSALRDDISHFENFNFNRDCQATLNCLKNLGVESICSDSRLTIKGRTLSSWLNPSETLNAENSGTTARLLSGLLVHLSFKTTLAGDSSLSKRPMKRIIDPLQKMGANIESTDGHLPLTFFPAEQINGIEYVLPVASAQVKSAVLLAGLFADGVTKVIENVPTRDHTERLLKLKVEYDQNGRKIISSSRENSIPDISMTIPGDFSSAAFFIAAALLLPDSELVIKNVSLNPTRTGFIDILEKMGVKLEVNITQESPEPMGEVVVRYQPLQNITVPAEIIPNIIDEIPILSVIAVKAEGTLELRHAKELRFKESDRITAMVQNLRAVGVEITEYEDGFKIEGPQTIKGGKIKTFGDHRIAMSFAIANLCSEQGIEIDRPECVEVSFPQFWGLLKSVVKK